MTFCEVYNAHYDNDIEKHISLYHDSEPLVRVKYLAHLERRIKALEEKKN